MTLNDLFQWPDEKGHLIEYIIEIYYFLVEQFHWATYCPSSGNVHLTWYIIIILFFSNESNLIAHLFYYYWNARGSRVEINIITQEWFIAMMIWTVFPGCYYILFLVFFWRRRRYYNRKNKNISVIHFSKKLGRPIWILLLTSLCWLDSDFSIYSSSGNLNCKTTWKKWRSLYKQTVYNNRSSL